MTLEDKLKCQVTRIEYDAVLKRGDIYIPRDVGRMNADELTAEISWRWYGSEPDLPGTYRRLPAAVALRPGVQLQRVVQVSARLATLP